ncbi:hypothetical protein [Porphyrobacter sp. YT40]|uniref:hypothetical protein n=1 Tax=Porphyrobacter sp. YT40 TaxID=2547601 RepID=UPI001144F016|nr:hypothetical protein [Porphyrobacter sp. YT40]QDH35833.1 hypothetical protein E2E27_16830 [Porphyrobacter sp. YT40]
MWLAFKLFASGALDAVLRGLSAALKWLLADWRNAVIAALAVFAAFHQFILNPRMSALVAQLQTSLTAEQAAHLGTVNAFLAASAQAQADAEANAARVRAEQETITHAKLADYRADLAALRARFERLRARDAAATDPRRADPAGLPQLPATPGRADAAPAQDRLPAARALSLDDALIASEQALQLQALIDWVAAQSAVRFTPEEPAE